MLQFATEHLKAIVGQRLLGKTWLWANSDGTVWQSDAYTKPLRRRSGGEQNWTTVCFAPNGDELLARSEAGWERWRLDPQTTGPEPGVGDPLTYPPHGPGCLLRTARGNLSLTRPTHPVHFACPEDLDGAVFSPDGFYLLATTTGSLLWWCVPPDGGFAAPAGSMERPREWAVGGRNLAYLESDSLHCRDLDSGQILSQAMIGPPMARVLIDTRGQYLVAERGSSDWNETFGWAIHRDRLELLWKRLLPPGAATSILEDGRTVCLESDRVRVLNRSGQEILSFCPSGGSPLEGGGVKLLPEQKALLVVRPLNSLEVWSLDTGLRLEARAAGHPRPLELIPRGESTPMGRLAAGPGGPFVMLELMDVGGRLHPIQALSPDRKRLLVDMPQGTAVLSLEGECRLEGWLSFSDAPIVATFLQTGELLVVTLQGELSRTTLP